MAEEPQITPEVNVGEKFLFGCLQRAARLGLVDNDIESIDVRVDHSARNDYSPAKDRIRIKVSPQDVHSSMQWLLINHVPLRNDVIQMYAQEMIEAKREGAPAGDFNKRMNFLRTLRELDPNEVEGFIKNNHSGYVVSSMAEKMGIVFSEETDSPYRATVRAAVEDMDDGEYQDWFETFYTDEVQKHVRHEKGHQRMFAGIFRAGWMTRADAVKAENAISGFPLMEGRRNYDLLNAMYEIDHVEITGQRVRFLGSQTRQGEYLPDEFRLMNLVNTERVRRTARTFMDREGRDMAELFLRYSYVGGIQEFKLRVEEQLNHPSDLSREDMTKFYRSYCESQRYFLPRSELLFRMMDALDNPDQLAQINDELAGMMQAEHVDKVVANMMVLVRRQDQDIDFNYTGAAQGSQLLRDHLAAIRGKIAEVEGLQNDYRENGRKPNG